MYAYEAEGDIPCRDGVMIRTLIEGSFVAAVGEKAIGIAVGAFEALEVVVVLVSSRYGPSCRD